MTDHKMTPITVRSDGRVVICTEDGPDRWLLIYPNASDAEFAARAMDIPLKRARRPGE